MIIITARLGEKIISGYYLSGKLLRIEIPEGLDKEDWKKYSAAADTFFEKLTRELNSSRDLSGFERIEYIVQSLCKRRERR